MESQELDVAYTLSRSTGVDEVVSILQVVQGATNHFLHCRFDRNLPICKVVLWLFDSTISLFTNSFGLQDVENTFFILQVSLCARIVVPSGLK